LDLLQVLFIQKENRGMNLKCKDVLGVRKPVVEEGSLLHSEGMDEVKLGKQFFCLLYYLGVEFNKVLVLN